MNISNKMDQKYYLRIKKIIMDKFNLKGIEKKQKALDYIEYEYQYLREIIG